MKKIEIKYYIVDIVLIMILLILITMSQIFIFVALIGYVIYLFIMWNFKTNTKKLAMIESQYNVLKTGKKRKGKDLSTQAVIVVLYKKKYFKQLKMLKSEYTRDKGKTLLRKLIKEYDVDVNNLKKYHLRLANKLTKFEKFIALYFYIKPNYLSNIDYGYGARIVTLDEFRLYKKSTMKELTFTDFIHDSKDIYCKKVKSFEGKNLYLSDGQIMFPSAYHNDLLKKYPSFPIFMSLAGQLYNMVIDNNSQVASQLWDKLRNQQDKYINVIETYPRFKSILSKIRKYLPVFRNYMFIKLRYYEMYESFERGLLPYQNSAGITNRALVKQMQKEYESQNGKIYSNIVVLKMKDIKYDSRYFHEVVFGSKAKV